MSDDSTGDGDVAAYEWQTYPHGPASGRAVKWPAFADTHAVWARCRHCTADVYAETLAAVGVHMVWHLYDDHPTVWRAQYGPHNPPVEARPADLDRRAVDADRSPQESTR